MADMSRHLKTEFAPYVNKKYSDSWNKEIPDAPFPLCPMMKIFD
jgi:hypothetical protein